MGIITDSDLNFSLIVGFIWLQNEKSQKKKALSFRENVLCSESYQFITISLPPQWERFKYFYVAVATVKLTTVSMDQAVRILLDEYVKEDFF